MNRDPHGRTRRRRVLSAALFGAAVGSALTGAACAAAAGMSFGEALDAFVVTNALIGVSFATCGVLVAWHRPRNPVGWLLLAAGVLQAVTAGAVPLVRYGLIHGWPDVLVRGLVTVATCSWPWAIGLCLPLLLQLFPGDAGLDRGWRWVAWATVLSSPLFEAELATEHDPIADGYPLGYTAVQGSPSAWLTQVAEARTLLVVLAGLAALAVRYRRGDEHRRRQLLWLVAAVLIMAVAWVPWAFVAGTPVVVLFSIPLVPAAMAIAILRHRLLDIRLVVSRTALYGLLTTGVAGVYIGLVALLDRVMREQVGLGSSLAATVLIAVGFNPVRVRLQRLVDRVLYGDRGDPVRAVSRVGERLAAGLPGVLEAVREALRLPFAALRAGGTEIAASGDAPELLHTLPVTYGPDRIGDLVIGLRPGEKRLGRTDRAVLELLAAPLSVAVHAVGLSDELRRSREAIVMAREEERRRLRRDLHDGLGPALTGVAFKADAAGNLLAADPDAARELIAELRGEVAHAVAGIRRLVYDLRPPALDDLGLVGAVRQAIDRLARDGMVVRLTAPDTLPALPAAVEAAAYRIAVEALTNAVRHSGAHRVDVRIHADGRLHVQVTDDGTARDRPWRGGVGMASMRERAAEVGGVCVAGPGPEGGRVAAALPLAVLR
ncbi:histidine kinase [Actinomadura sp. NPDC048394]|uniref:sensor histidine kinase n=1 Tax=Actinomadura sp. NPDC048394 TaxID=3158223 RepID=UPI0033F77C08